MGIGFGIGLEIGIGTRTSLEETRAAERRNAC